MIEWPRTNPKTFPCLVQSSAKAERTPQAREASAAPKVRANHLMKTAIQSCAAASAARSAKPILAGCRSLKAHHNAYPQAVVQERALLGIKTRVAVSVSAKPNVRGAA